MDDSYALPLGMVITYILALLLFGNGCNDVASDSTQVSVSGQIISVNNKCCKDCEIITTIVFDNGQVESIERPIGDTGDIVFFDPVTIYKADSSIAYIPYTSVIKNITKGREFYGQ